MIFSLLSKFYSNPTFCLKPNMAENAMLCDKNKTAKSTQVQGKSAPKPKMGSQPTVRACPHLCNMVPTNVPEPGAAQAVIHPGKDVFVVKVCN